MAGKKKKTSNNNKKKKKKSLLEKLDIKVGKTSIRKRKKKMAEIK